MTEKTLDDFDPGIIAALTHLHKAHRQHVKSLSQKCYRAHRKAERAFRASMSKEYGRYMHSVHQLGLTGDDVKLLNDLTGFKSNHKSKG